MGKKKGAAKALTQEEIWDDSALVQGWNEAVEEYKLYHSIHAKGENIEDVLREAEAKEAAETESVQDQNQDEQDDDMADADVAPVEPPQVPQMDSIPKKQPDPAKESGTAWTGPTGTAGMPNPILSQVQDEGLKNLMIAWYYAGYYSGLYEGQQRANQNNKST